MVVHILWTTSDMDSFRDNFRPLLLEVLSQKPAPFPFTSPHWRQVNFDEAGR